MAKKTKHEFLHQRLVANKFINELEKFQNQLNRRKDLWDKLSPEGRQKYISISEGKLNDSKDPVLNVAINLYKYLKEWGFDEYDRER
jgi:hypothetical protein